MYRKNRTPPFHLTSSNRIVLRALLFPGKREGRGGRGMEEAIRDRKFKKLRKYAAGHGGGGGGGGGGGLNGSGGGGRRVAAAGVGWKVVVRWRNYVVPCNSHPNDSWMIKAGYAVHAREVRIDSWSNRRGKILIRFVQNSYSFDRWGLELGTWIHRSYRTVSWKIEGRGISPPPSPPSYGTKRLTPSRKKEETGIRFFFAR